MLKYIAILSLIILSLVTLFGQEFHIRNGSHIVNLQTKPLLSKTGNNIYKPGNINSLYHVLPNTDDVSFNARGPVGTYNYERGVYLITPAEMAAAGIPAGINITQIKWNYYTPGSISITGNLKVYLENTSDVTNTKSTTWIDAVRTMTFVDNNTSFTIPSADHVIETFSTPSAFTYTGGGLYIAFDYFNTSVNTGTAIYVNSALTNGNLSAQSNTSSPITVAPSNFRPETYLGLSIANDAQVVQVYTLGKLPVPFAAPHQVIAVVQNNGTNDFYNLNVSLNVTGANTFTDSKTIDTLHSGDYKFVTFTSWTPAVKGIDTVKVSVPPDDLNSNNSNNVIQLITPNNYSYAYGPFPSAVDGGGGFNGQTGDFVEKFYAGLPAYLNQVNGNYSASLNPAPSVNQVSVNFTVGGQPYKIGIWDATGTGGTPGTLLWESTSLISTVGVSTILVNPKVHVNGNFYVGVRQTGTTNIAFAFQSEDPVRENTFYSASPSGSSAWTDFAVSGNPFRFMIEPGLTLPDDLGVSSIDFPLGGTYNNITSNVSPKATITNFGSNNQTSAFNVTMDIYDPIDNKVYTSTRSLTLNAGQSQQVTFDASFNPSAKSYTANCYTTLETDEDNSIDMVSASFNYAQFSLNLTALMQGFFNGTSMVPDTVIVELRDTTAPYVLEASQKVVLNTIGTGFINNFDTPLNNFSHYYIVIRHRNSIEAWSAFGNLFNPSSLSYDFTSAASQAFGNNMILKGGKYCLYSGDITQDGSVDLSDLGLVFNDNVNFVSGYVPTDVNGDGSTDLSDLGIVYNNSTNFVGKVVPPGASL